MGLATLFSGNCRISNPILFCNPESPESPETTGVAGRCDPEVGSIATPPPFSCLLFDHAFLFSLAGSSSISVHIFAASLRRCLQRICAAAGGKAGAPHKSPKMPSRRIYRRLPCSTSTLGANCPTRLSQGQQGAFPFSVDWKFGNHKCCIM